MEQRSTLAHPRPTSRFQYRRSVVLLHLFSLVRAVASRTRRQQLDRRGSRTAGSSQHRVTIFPDGRSQPVGCRRARRLFMRMGQVEHQHRGPQEALGLVGQSVRGAEQWARLIDEPSQRAGFTRRLEERSGIAVRAQDPQSTRSGRSIAGRCVLVAVTRRTFLMEEGALVVHHGPNALLGVDTHRPEFSAAEAEHGQPYQGLESSGKTVTHAPCTAPGHPTYLGADVGIIRPPTAAGPLVRLRLLLRFRLRHPL